MFDCTDHSAYTTLNWGAGGIRELTLEANKIEQMLKYRKASFPKSVSTTFVAHCSSEPVRVNVAPDDIRVTEGYSEKEQKRHSIERSCQLFLCILTAQEIHKPRHA